MHVLKGVSGVPKLKDNVFPLFHDVGALGNSSSYAGLQSLPDKFWVMECVPFRISMFCRDLPPQKKARRNSGVISRDSGVISHKSGVISRTPA